MAKKIRRETETKTPPAFRIHLTYVDPINGKVFDDDRFVNESVILDADSATPKQVLEACFSNVLNSTLVKWSAHIRSRPKNEGREGGEEDS